MQRQSPPKHRHDGTSPLPLGMDWSPPPKKWAGQETIWPHDPHTGWSYCVTIPSWVVLAKSRDSDPVVFYRVVVGLQSPDGITSTRIVLRRFNDFLKFHAALKKIFPKKNLPPAPPKGFSRLKTKVLLEERRSSLEEWMTKLLSDIDLSRSVATASFLELEAAARSSFQDEQQLTSEPRSPVNNTASSLEVHPSAGLSIVAGSSSLASDYGSDTAYEASDVDSTSHGRGNPSELGTEDLSLDEDLTSPIDKFMKYGMSNIDEGLFMGQAILEQLGSFPRHKTHAKEISNVMEESMSNGSAMKSSYISGDTTAHFSEQDHSHIIHHARKFSAESVGSDIASQRGSELANSSFPNSFGDGCAEIPKASKASGNTEILGKDLTLPDHIQLVLPSDQRHKMHRVLTTMQRRLVTAKTDMEDLISRLNQEIAVKDYLSTKVKDLEVELEATKEKSKENLEQAILVERERVTQMQWDMEDLRRKSMEMEHKLNSQQGEINKDSSITNLNQEKDALQQELTATKLQFEDLLKRHQELEVKSRADIKVLIKEVKTLRSSQSELKHQLSESFKEKAETERRHAQERQISDRSTAWWKLLHDCEILQQRVEECKINLADEEENLIKKFQSLPDAMHLLTTSDNQINLLLTEVQQLSQRANSVSVDDTEDNVDTDTMEIIEKMRKMLTNVFINNGKLRKQVNSVLRCALETKMSFQNVTECSQGEGENIQHDELDE
nr:Myosin-9 like [Ipomoea batatas]